MLQFITSNVDVYNKVDPDKYIKDNMKEEKEYFLGLFDLFKQYTIEILSQKDKKVSDIVNTIFSTMYEDYKTYMKTPVKEKEYCVYRKSMAILCGLSTYYRYIINAMANVIWSGDMKLIGDYELDLRVERILAYDLMHRFKMKYQEAHLLDKLDQLNQPNNFEWVESKRAIDKALNFIKYNTNVKECIIKYGNSITKLAIITDVFNDANIELDKLKNKSFIVNYNDSDSDDDEY